MRFFSELLPVISANNNVRSRYDDDKYNHRNKEHINMILLTYYYPRSLPLFVSYHSKNISEAKHSFLRLIESI